MKKTCDNASCPFGTGKVCMRTTKLYKKCLDKIIHRLSHADVKHK